MFNPWGAMVCATAMWAIVVSAAYFEPAKRAGKHGS